MKALCNFTPYLYYSDLISFLVCIISLYLCISKQLYSSSYSVRIASLKGNHGYFSYKVKNKIRQSWTIYRVKYSCLSLLLFSTDYSFILFTLQNSSSYRKDISNRARNIVRRAEKQLLQDRVKCINAILQDNKGRIVASKSRLFSLVTNMTTLQRCIEFINKVREFNFIKVRDRQVNKFNR